MDLDDLDPRFLHGQAAYREERTDQVEYTHSRTGEKMLSPVVTRHVWKTDAAPDLDAGVDGFMAEELTHLPDPAYTA